MNENLVIILPPEVSELAKQVKPEKQQEVNNVLNQIFTKTSEWKKQVEAIEIKGIDDKTSIRLAETYYKNAKDTRLEFEKIFDCKREEVGQLKREYDLEDKLWLKSKQTMQILLKDIQDSARYKADYVKRYESEQKELKTLQRITQVQKFNSEIEMTEFENMSDEMFTIFLSGIEKKYNDEIAEQKRLEAEKLEAERISKLHNDRKESILNDWSFLHSDYKNVNFGEISDDNWTSILEQITTAKKQYEAEQEKIKQDNLRLQKEKEAKEKEIEAERKKQADILAKQKSDAEAKAKIEAEKQTKIQAELKAKADKERIEREKIQAELKAKKDAELKAKQEAEAKAKAEKQAKEKADKAPDKQKLTIWVNSFNLVEFNLKTDNAKSCQKVIIEKFNAFKVWAESQINNL